MAELADAWAVAGRRNVFGQVPEIFEVTPDTPLPPPSFPSSDLYIFIPV